MRKTNRIILVSICLLAWLCLTQSKPTSAQTKQPTVESIPGIPAGYTIIDGDIQMPMSVVNAMRQQGRLSPNSPQATFNNNLWPNGIVPFQYETKCEQPSTCNTAMPGGCVGLARIAALLDAMKVLRDSGRIDFRQCPNNQCSGNFVHVRDSTNDVTTASGSNACVDQSRNNSPVGMQGGQQTINLVSWGSKFVIVHELMHTLGFFHEQSSPLRDTYVDVATYCKNITGGCMGDTDKANFPKKDNALIYGGYDFDSVMHYGQCSFSRNDGTVKDGNGNLVPACPATSPTFPDGGITINVKAPFNMQWQSKIGQRDHLSTIDQLTLMQLYAQPNWRFVDATNTRRPFGTFLDPYASLATGINATPLRGTLLIQPGTYRDVRVLSKPMTLRAPLGGVTINPINGGVAGGPVIASISAASYNGELAADSIAAAFGENLAASTAIASSLPLPTTLAGVTVKVKDADGTERDAPLFFVSPNQINYQVPAGTSAGIANITAYSGGAVVARGTVPITAAAPALFSASASGQGVASAIALRVRGDAQFYEPVASYDGQQQRFVAVPIDLGPESDQVFLILFGTGFRAAGTGGVIVTIGDQEAEVLYAGPAPGFAGLDQANVRIPRSLIGKGEVTIQLTADNRSANVVTVNIR